MDPNSPEALLRRREAATLTWRGPTLIMDGASVLIGVLLPLLRA